MRFTYWLFLFFIHIFRFTPFWLLYLFSDFLYYFFYYVYRYRRKVVMNNLQAAFPEKQEECRHRHRS